MYVDPGRPGTVLVKTTFAKKNVLTIAKQTFLQAELCQILARKFSKLTGYVSFLFRAGSSALKCFLLQKGNYADSHTSTASTSHRGEDLCSLRTTSWGWSLWQHSMRHRWFQYCNWFSPLHGRQFCQTHRVCELPTHAKPSFLGPFLGNIWRHQSATWFVPCLPWVSDVQMSQTFWPENKIQEAAYLPSEPSPLRCPRPTSAFVPAGRQEPRRMA